MFCNCGYWATSRITQTITCPACKEPLLVLCLEDQGRAAWAELHSKANPDPDWFAGWLRRVPNYECKCRDKFMALLRLYPPDYDDFANWAVFIHNEVNKQLGKPLWQYTEPEKPST